MADEKHVPNACQPMVGTWADPDNVKCRDCGLRDRTVVKSPDGKRDIPVGITRSFCEFYSSGKGKPTAILFHGADCDYYIKD